MHPSTGHLGSRIAAALVAAGFAWPAAAQQVTIQRDSELHAEARMDSPVVAKVKQGTSGEITGKSGPWVDVKTPGATGWVFSFNVQFGGGQKTGGGEGAALGRLLGPSHPVNVTSTIGVRGIDVEDLKQATFNADQMKLLDQYAVTKGAAEENARTAGLEPQKVKFLDEKAP